MPSEDTAVSVRMTYWIGTTNNGDGDDDDRPTQTKVFSQKNTPPARIGLATDVEEPSKVRIY